MSGIQIKAFFKFCKVKVLEQFVDFDANKVMIKVEPDKRYDPICYKCGQKVKEIHSHNKRTVRDLNIFDAQTFISVAYRTIRCFSCGLVVEKMEMMDIYQRVTRRLAQYILELCKLMTIKEVARHLGIDWKTVKGIHKSYLKERYGEKQMVFPRVIAVDEISLKKRHHYLTVVINWETGEVLWVGEGRRYETLKTFFDSLSQAQKDSIEVVAIDMWDPYIKAVKESCPGAAIVFDQFHVVKAFGKVIDKVRNAEYRKEHRESKEVIKGSKYLLLKNKENLLQDEKPKLKSLLKLNKPIMTAYILKDYLKKLWQYKYRKSAKRFLEFWCQIAEASKIRSLISFAKTLKRYAYGIINHCQYPIHTS